MQYFVSDPTTLDAGERQFGQRRRKQKPCRQRRLIVRTARETIGLGKQFDELAVTGNLSLRIQAGERHAAKGQNGACKRLLRRGALAERSDLLKGDESPAVPASAGRSCGEHGGCS